MSYFSFEEAFEVLQKCNSGKAINEITISQFNRSRIRKNFGIRDYETVCKIYEINNKHFLIYDVSVGAHFTMFNIKQIYLKSY